MNARTLYNWLPAVLRLRDQEIASHVGGLLSGPEVVEYDALIALAAPTPAQRARLDELQDKLTTGPLKALLEVLSEPIAALQENLDQLYDDLFIETCADWVVPYIGDLIGYRTLHGQGFAGSQRAEVAHTIAFRRRKGTASMLEQLARDVTGWNARVVEYFQRLATTQYMNHVRLDRPASADLRRGEALGRGETAFEAFAHGADVRRIASARGRFNIPNVGVFLWPFEASSLTRSPAVGLDPRRFVVHPLGIAAPLITSPDVEDDISHLAEPINVPAPISRRTLYDNLADYYGETRSLAVYVAGAPWPIADVRVRHLGDLGATWNHMPEPGTVAVDPVLGRVALGDPLPAGQSVEVTSFYAAPMKFGGGEYERTATFRHVPDAGIERVSSHNLPGHHQTIQGALAALAPAGLGGVVEIVDSGRYEIAAADALTIDVPAGHHVEVRAGNFHRPTIVLERALVVQGGADATASLNGLLLTGPMGQVLVEGGHPVPGELVRVPEGAGNRLAGLTVAHCTLVPGRSLDASGQAEHADEPSVVFARGGSKLDLSGTITGALRVHDATETTLVDCVVDAVAPEHAAYAGLAAGSSGGGLSATECTIVGTVSAVQVDRLSNTICLSRVTAERHQEGCVRFSYLPLDSRVPRRYRCSPRENEPPRGGPRFASLRFGSPLYAWLAPPTPVEILRGADDEGEMGALHAVFRPHREANLRIRLDEYLRAGLEAGVFHETAGLRPGDEP